MPLALLLAWLPNAAARAETEAVDFRLRVRAVSGFVKDGGAFRPLADCIDLSGGEPVAWEGAKLDQAIWDPGGGVREDPDAGGRIVAGYRMLRYTYCADDAANGYLWARVRQGDGTNCVYVSGHQWNSETEFRELGKDPSAAHKEWAGKWRWARLRPLGVVPGVNDLLLVYSWPGSPELARFAVTFDDQSPEGREPEARRTKPSAYWVESDDLVLPAAERLLSAEVRGDAGGGDLEASADGGQTWVQPRELPLSGRLRLRLSFPAGVTPAAKVADFGARIETDASRYLVLDYGERVVGVDVTVPGVLRLEGRDAAGPFAAPSAAMPLFTLELKKRGEPWPEPRYILEPKDGQLVSARRVTEAGRQAIVLEHAFLDGQIGATATLSLGEGGMGEWSLALDNRSEWDILTFTFPRVAGLQVGDSGYDDCWLNTNRYGPWMAGFQPEDRPYPGWGALGFVDLYDGQAGLSFATHDPTEGITDFRLRPTVARWGETVYLEARKDHCVPSGTSRRWTYAVLLHSGDWHAAADVYGIWFRARFGVADHFPEWARDSNGWVSTNPYLSDSFYKWPMLLDTFEEGRRMGVMHVQAWGQFGSSSCASFWWPSPKYGPIEEFASVNRRIREQGGHVGYYLMYDRENRYNEIDTETYEGYLPQSAYPPGVPRLGEEALVQGEMVADPQGKLAAWPANDQEMMEFRDSLARLHAEKKTTTWADSETWPQHSMVAMNPMEEGWRKWLELWTSGLYVTQWGCDTAYQDVLGAANVGRSFDLRRGDHGQVYNGEMEVARRLAEAGRQADPSFALTAEGKQELVTRWAMGMASSSHYGWIDHAAHRYTHPDHILFLGGQNGGYQQMRRNCELAYLYGSRFDLVMTGDIPVIRRIVTFREGFKRFVTRATYRDTMGIEVEGEGIEATRHDRAEGDTRAVLVTIVNSSGTESGKLTVDLLALGEASYGAFWLLDDWTVEEAALSTNQGRGSAAIPPNHLSALLVVAQAAPEETLVGGVLPERTPEGYRARAWLANLAAERRSVRLSLEGPGTLPPAEAVALQPFGALNKTWEVAFAPNVPRFGDVALLADGRPIARGFLYALVEDGSFETDGTPLADAADGQRVVRFGPAKGWQGTYRNLDLVPGRRYRAALMARRTGDKGDMYCLVRLRDGSDQWHYTRLGFPAGRFGEWLTLTADFEAPAALHESNVYLYNMNTEETVDYDALTIEMLP